MVNILQKHIAGIVEKGFGTIPGLRSQQLSDQLIKMGKSDPKAVVKELHSSFGGLSKKEALIRLETYGKNEVTHDKPPVWWIQLISAFVNPFILILVVLGITSLFADVILVPFSARDFTKVIILSIMVSISALLRFWQEFRSQIAAEKLQAMVQNKATIERTSWGDKKNGNGSHGKNSHEREIPITELVTGDIVHLSSGDMVPADIRLLSSKDLFVSQSALTGESIPVEKYAKLSEVSEKSEKKDGDITNPLELGTLCFMGTNVVTGSSIGIVVATGSKTYFGAVAKGVVGKRTMTSFDKGVNKVSWLLIRFMLVMVPVVFVLNGYTKHNWHDAFFFAISVAVGLTPEMLPMVVTANLAKGAVKMAKKKIIVKKLNAIQNFGAMDVLCTDKTGTLTENRVVLMRYLDTFGKENTHVLSLAFLNSYFQTGLKNIMDSAVIHKKEEMHQTPEIGMFHKIDEIPFDFERRRMSVIVEKDQGEHLLICKGAIEEILQLCTKVEENGKAIPIAEVTKEITHRHLTDLAKNLNEDGLRVIAVAYKIINKKKRFYKISDENDLILSGYIGFLDPAKASAKQAIRLLEQHGITVKIITGDNEVVTSRICRDVQLNEGKPLLGADINKLSDEELAEVAEKTTIFAKVDPLQKARIVEAIKRNGHTVGYMGDGINDAAAMRAADVGVSVDTAVDIAKEAADIILLETDLLVLEKGVLEGRTVFGNIMKYIKMTASSNFGNVLSILVASAFLPFLPMMSLQLLLQNLLYDISQISLPWDNMDEEFLKIPRKWEATGIERFMVFLGSTSSLFDIATFLVLWYVFGANSIAHQSLFQSGWFVEGLISQTLIVHMLRTQKIPFVQSHAATPVLLLTATIMLVGISIPFTLVGHHIGLQPLPLPYFAFLLIILLSYCTVTQIVKTWYIKKFKIWL